MPAARIGRPDVLARGAATNHGEVAIRPPELARLAEDVAQERPRRMADEEVW